MKQYGTTFSHLQCDYLNLDYQEAYLTITALPFSVIRLCAYWNEIELKEGMFDFTRLDWLVSHTPKDKRLVLSVGEKVPRWPEFHIPSWVRDSRHQKYAYLQKTLDRYKSNPQVAYIQVENEALNSLPITNGRYLQVVDFEEEVAFVRTKLRKDQKILLTCAINLNEAKQGEDVRIAQLNTTLADAVGVNIYTRVPTGSIFGFKRYQKPTATFWQTVQGVRQYIVSTGKEAWVTELQAEPWEQGDAVHTKKLNYPSASPETTMESIGQLHLYGYDTILLWGSEYWFWHQKQGSRAWIDAITVALRVA